MNKKDFVCVVIFIAVLIFYIFVFGSCRHTNEQKREQEQIDSIEIVNQIDSIDSMSVQEHN